jgi:hypothetical protein
MKIKIEKYITIEDLLDVKPESVKYMMEKGIKCLACGEPIWGTLESASKAKGFSEGEIEEFVKDLNQL